MNKAFVREPDDTGVRYCPKCGSVGTPVAAETLDAQLDATARAELADAAFYCPFAKCPVAYFDNFERTVAVERLKSPAYPKDPAAPLCNCFGVMAAEIDADIAENGVTRTRELVAKSKSAAAHCLTAQPDGRSCAAEAQRYYMRAKNA